MFDLKKYDLDLGQGHVAIFVDVDFIKTHHDARYQTHALSINQALAHITQWAQNIESTLIAGCQCWFNIDSMFIQG